VRKARRTTTLLNIVPRGRNKTKIKLGPQCAIRGWGGCMKDRKTTAHNNMRTTHRKIEGKKSNINGFGSTRRTERDYVCVRVPCCNDPALCQHSATSNGLMHVCVCVCACVCLRTNTLFVISVKTRSVCDNGERVFQNRVVSVFCVCESERASVYTVSTFCHNRRRISTRRHTHTKAHTYTFYRHSR